MKTGFGLLWRGSAFAPFEFFENGRRPRLEKLETKMRVQYWRLRWDLSRAVLVLVPARKVGELVECGLHRVYENEV